MAEEKVDDRKVTAIRFRTPSGKYYEALIVDLWLVKLEEAEKIV